MSEYQIITDKGIYKIETEEKKSLLGFVSNVPKSIWGQIKGAGEFFAEPTIKTGQMLYDIAKGQPIPEAHKSKVAEGILQIVTNPKFAYQNMIINRYGSKEAFLNTLYNDPASVAMDLSVILGGTGGTLSKAGTMTKVPELVKLGNVGLKAAEYTNPIALGVKGTGVVMQGAGKVASAISKPFAGQVNQSVLESANALGIELPASAISKSPAVKTIETLGGKGFFGGKIVDMVSQANNRLSQVADEAVRQIGKTTDFSDAGKNIAVGMDKFRETFFEIKKKLYKEAVIPKKGNIITVDPTESLNFINVILEKKKAAASVLGKSTDISYFENLKQALTKKQLPATEIKSPILNPQGKNYVNIIPGKKNLLSEGKINAYEFKSAIQELNNKISNFNDPVTTGNKSILQKLVTTMSDDLDSAIKTQRPDLSESIDIANSFYKENLNKLNSKYGYKIKELSDAGQYDKIVPAIMGPSVSADDIPRIFEVIGKDNIPQVQSVVLEDIFNKAKNPATGVFTPQGIARNLSKYGEDKLSKIFTPKQLKTIDNIKNVSEGLGNAKGLAEGSQTAFIGRIALELGMSFSHPLLALKAIVGDALFSKFISSNVGRQWITTGNMKFGKIGQTLQIGGQKLLRPLTPPLRRIMP